MSVKNEKYKQNVHIFVVYLITITVTNITI